MSYEAILYAVQDKIATITLNRPESRNGYTSTMANELGEALRAANLDEDVRVVVLTGAGKDFCVGMDMAGGNNEAEDFLSPDWVEGATRATRPIAEMDKPVIAAVHGAAVGVGSTMILPADFRLASTEARFGFTFTRRGLFPEGGSTWFLPRIVGLGRATDWMVSGRIFPASEALEAGLVRSLHEPDELLPAAHELARELITTTAPVSTAVIRRALIHMLGEASPNGAFALDSKLIAHAVTKLDSIEGIGSFLMKRPPQFTGTIAKDMPDFLPWRTNR